MCFLDLSIGVKESTVFAVFHEDAMDLFNSCSDLKKVAWDLADPNSRLHDDVRTSSCFILIFVCIMGILATYSRLSSSICIGENCEALQTISANALRQIENAA